MKTEHRVNIRVQFSAIDLGESTIFNSIGRRLQHHRSNLGFHSWHDHRFPPLSSKLHS